MKKAYIPILVVFCVLFIDQTSKFWVKTHMYLGQEYNVIGNWFKIHFTENKGMAFGIEFWGKTGKLLLSLFRIVAVILISWYLYALTKKQTTHPGLIVSLALILAGALGNIIDSVFYGVLFSASGYSPAAIAEFMPVGGGYSSFMYGSVVDMLYFPIIKGYLPEWLPFWGGEHFVFFRPVFNLADSAITTGVILIFIFQKRFFGTS